MAHRIYHTKGIILRSTNMGESNKLLLVFTQDLGRIAVMVQGVRALSSKLRYVLQDYSLVHFDLVRGRAVWRVTSAQALRTEDGVYTLTHKQSTARLCSLLHRLCPEEEHVALLWEDIEKGVAFLQATELSASEIRALEIMLAVKILNHLGYWGEDKKFLPILELQDWSIETLRNVLPLAPPALVEIRAALSHSHL